MVGSGCLQIGNCCRVAGADPAPDVEFPGKRECAEDQVRRRAERALELRLPLPAARTAIATKLKRLAANRAGTPAGAPEDPET